MENEASFHIIGRVVSGKVIDNVGHLTVSVNGTSDQQGSAIREARYVDVVFLIGRNWVRHIKKGTLVRIKGDLISASNAEEQSPVPLQAVARRYTSIHATDEDQIMALEDAA
tara:strand:- start:3518 stop:3853 length:336 start_codon:yes stop_codon:yes gene_type:complete